MVFTGFLPWIISLPLFYVLMQMCILVHQYESSLLIWQRSQLQVTWLQRYLIEQVRLAESSWHTFIKSHPQQIAAADFSLQWLPMRATGEGLSIQRLIDVTDRLGKSLNDMHLFALKPSQTIIGDKPTIIVLANGCRWGKVSQVADNLFRLHGISEDAFSLADIKEIYFIEKTDFKLKKMNDASVLQLVKDHHVPQPLLDNIVDFSIQQVAPKLWRISLDVFPNMPRSHNSFFNKQISVQFFLAA